MSNNILQCVDADGGVHGYDVVRVSGGADYIKGFPRSLALAQIADETITTLSPSVTYYHESVVNDLRQKLNTARASSEILTSALRY